MIKLTTSKHIFEERKVVLDYLRGDDVTETKREGAAAANWMRLELSGEQNDEEFEAFHQQFLEALSATFDLYWVYIEGTKQPKRKIRSHTKLFYEWRKNGQLEAGTYAEREIAFGDEESILAGAIQLCQLDTAVLSELISLSTFRFGFGVAKQAAAASKTSPQTLVDALDQGLIEDGRFVRLSHLGLMEALLHPDAFLYSYLYDGKDDLVFTVYCGKAIYDRFRQLLIAHLPNEGELVEAAPNASDTEDLVRLYFKDWRS